MTIHLCLLSEQPSPNICPLFDSRVAASEVVFVVSPQQRNAVEAMEKLLKPRGIKVSTLAIENAYNFQLVLEHIEQKIQQLKGQPLLINATGGTKPMSIAAHMAGFNHNIPVYYIQNDRLFWLYAPEAREDFDLENRLKLREFLIAHGFSEESRKLPMIPPQHMGLFEEIVRTSSFASHVKTLNYLAWRAEESKNLQVPLQGQLGQQQDFQAFLDRLQHAGLVKAGRDDIRFASDEARALCNGLWLEDYCFKAINSIKEDLPNFQDASRGLAIKGQGKGKTPVDNELDIAILYHNRIYIIECKTRRFDEKGNPDVENALYKLATLSRNVGGAFASAMLVSFYPVAEKYKKRADALGIELVDGPATLRNISGRITAWLTRSNS